MKPLVWAGRRGPWVLVAGLLAGLAFPRLAETMLPWLPQMVVGLLFLAALKMEPRGIFGSLSDLPKALVIVFGLQLLLPLVILAVVFGLGWQDSSLALALVIMASAPSIIGSPNFCMMVGRSPVFAMRILVIGTALLPLTVLPVFWLLPGLGGLADILSAVLRLFLTILLTILASAGARRFLLPNPSPGLLASFDGASAILLAVFVIGLMPAVSEVIWTAPAEALFWLLVVFIANFGLQLATYGVLRGKVPPDISTAAALIAGNRNIALFFVALPVEVTAPIMLFIGCYQIPMYLTPLVMKKIY